MLQDRICQCPPAWLRCPVRQRVPADREFWMPSPARHLGCLQYVRRLSLQSAAKPSRSSPLSVLHGSAPRYGVKKVQSLLQYE